MTLAPTTGAIRPAPEPVKKMRSRCGVRPCCASSRDKKLQDFFRLLGVVPFVGLGDHFAGRRGENVLDRGAAHVDAADHRAIALGRQLLRRLDFHHARVPHERRDLDETSVSH